MSGSSDARCTREACPIIGRSVGSGFTIKHGMGAYEAFAYKMPVLCGTFALVPHFDMGYTVHDGKVAQSEGFGSLFCLGRLDCPCPFRRSAKSTLLPFGKSFRRKIIPADRSPWNIAVLSEKSVTVPRGTFLRGTFPRGTISTRKVYGRFLRKRLCVSPCGAPRGFYYFTEESYGQQVI